jgi:hypothetical protein
MAASLDALIVDALRRSASEPGEQRLFRAGKHAGLFASRAGNSGEAAACCLREGLLEVVRSDSSGKMQVDWVHATPKGIRFLHDRESPLQILEELIALLKTTDDRVPVWLQEMHGQLQELAGRLTQEAARWSHRLDALASRVEEALRRAEARPGLGAAGPESSLGAAVLTYLDRRRETGVEGPCSLPELFAALRDHQSDLRMKDFHDELRHLRDRGALTLVAFGRPLGELPQPEYALPEGNTLYYEVQR